MVFLLYGLIKWNELSLGLPVMEACMVRRAVSTGIEWPSALLAAERALARNRPFSASCRLAGGGLVYASRMGSGYMIHSCPSPERECYLPGGISTFRTAAEWEVGLREQLFNPRLCRSLVISTSREHEITLEVDSLGRVSSTSAPRHRD